MKCNDCNSTTIIQTESRLVCYDCGLVHQDQLYDYGPTFSDSQEYDTFEPLLENERLAIDTIKRLKNWLNRDISLQLEMALVQEVEQLADELLLYDHKCYPSQYYWAGAIIYSRKYEHITRKQVIEYLYGRFDSGCERMLKKIGKIIHNKGNGTNLIENSSKSHLLDKLNNHHTNQFNEHLKEYWLDKILQLSKLQYGKNGKKKYTKDELFERTNIPKTTYYRYKKRLKNGGYSKSGNESVYDKYPQIGKVILELRDQGLTYDEIQQHIIDNCILLFDKSEEYLEVAYRTPESIMYYVNSNS